MSTFEIVTFVVAFLGIALCFTSYFRPGRALADLGHQGSVWFDHQEDHEIDDRPIEDAVDSPIPHRPLRARY
jgi:hypothetical protein